MSPRTKLNYTLLILTIIRFTVPAIISYNIQEKHTKQEALETAGIVIEIALAVRKNTVNQVRSLLKKSKLISFYPQQFPLFQPMNA